MQGFIKKSFPGLGHSFVPAFGGREGAVRTGGGAVFGSGFACCE